MSDDPIPKDVILKDRFSYPNWFLSLRFNAFLRGRGPTPEAPKELQAADLKEQYKINLKRLAANVQEELREASKIDVKYTNIQTWISVTVENQILRNAQATLVIQRKITIQDLLKELRD
ncbi:hypothetical protein DL770_007240 [Monosporascus sp. CRB-9-2]|nr:hypothetical protein DL770_007240 [Monosporascus sp. CRB-9-2]